MAEDIDKLVDWARSQGWDVQVNTDGYRYFYTPDGTYVVRHPNSPSRSRRRFLDVVTRVRAHGLAWPPPSKKELRSQRRKEK